MNSLENIYVSQILNEARKKFSDAYYDMLSHNKQIRHRNYKPINSDSQRYKERRIHPERKKHELGNKFDSMSNPDGIESQVTAIIFNWIPFKDPTILQYIRYSLTNRWSNRFHFNKIYLDKLQAAVEGDNTTQQNKILDLLISKHKINDQAKANFLSYDKEKKLRNIEAWRKQKAITNPLFNLISAQEFLNADKNTQFKIFEKWVDVTLPNTAPQQYIKHMIEQINNNKHFYEI